MEVSFLPPVALQQVRTLIGQRQATCLLWLPGEVAWTTWEGLVWVVPSQKSREQTCVH